jgi:hypothetical protein
LAKATKARTVETVNWGYKGELIAACNCDWGCPCNFNARPTNGFCNGVYAVNIRTGTCGDVSLDGIKFVFAGKYPGAIHEGRGIVKILIDEKASKEQKNALEQILKGKLKGMPWGLFAPTVDNWLDVDIVPFEWKFDGPRSYYKAGTQAQATLEPMRNPVTGAETAATVVLPNGIVCKELNATATQTFSLFAEGLKFAAPGKYGFYTTVDHHS